ncbi:MAG: class I SAM-dependent methyltransferase, partial [Gammaproteobacteria bacterium]
MIDAVEKHFQNRGEAPEFLMEMRWIARHLPANAEAVLDMGCGNGSLFPLLGAERTVGLDYLPEGLDVTRERFPNTPLICADASKMPLPDAHFDAVVSQHVIE